MDYQSYNDYMRNTLGYSSMNCPNSCMNMPSPYQNMFPLSDDLERMYPDTYRVVYPMVVSACNMVSMPVTEEMLDRMTDDIYDRAAMDSRINIDINIEVETREEDANSGDRQMTSLSRPRRPRRRNRFFRDLIRILLLRELLGRRPRFPMRPF